MSGKRIDLDQGSFSPIGISFLLGLLCGNFDVPHPLTDIKAVPARFESEGFSKGQ
jgi:hypothetical protein